MWNLNVFLQKGKGVCRKVGGGQKLTLIASEREVIYLYFSFILPIKEQHITLINALRWTNEE